MSSEIKVDTISENTSANGIAIDGLTLKDGNVGAAGTATSLAGIPFLTPLQASIHAALLDSFSSRHATGPLLLLDSAKLDKEVKVTLLQILV